MLLSDPEIFVLARTQLGAQWRDDARVLLERSLKPAGECIALGPHTLTMPFTGYMVFIDLIPEANWGHPAAVLCLSEDGAHTQLTPCRFPPFFGDMPDTMREVRES